MNKLVWLRNDLRIHDNPSFTQAFANEKTQQVFAVYCICDAQWDQHDVADVRRLLLIRTLKNLYGLLQEKGIQLFVLDSKNYATSVEHIHTLALELNCDQVYCAFDYPLNERRRDKAAHDLLKKSDIELIGSHHTCLLPINSIRKKDGESYQVFTPYKNMFLKYLDGSLSAPRTLQTSNTEKLSNNIKFNADSKSHKTLVEDSTATIEKYESKYKTSSDICDLYLHKEDDILEQLNIFCRTDINEYHIQRDIPSSPGTSQLSMYLSLGSLSVRTAFSQAKRLSQNMDGCQIWINELLWREFYRNIVANHARISLGRTYKENYQKIPWTKNEDHLQAWKNGTTGIPLVDAAMRQLKATGWMHNRLRMVSAMFLTKYLLIDWREGERHFMQHLADGDFAANNGGWQWSASTGTDAAPYFRVLSPIRQAQRFDANAEFIKRYIPELTPYTAKDICAMNSKVWLDSSYPQPIIDLASAKKHTIEIFKQYSKA